MNAGFWEWLLTYAIVSLFYAWILYWGGAEKIEGWLALFVIGWFAVNWNEQQIKLYTYLVWILTTLLFLIGLNPKYRMSSL